MAVLKFYEVGAKTSAN